MVNPDPSNASNLSSGSVPVAQLGNVDTATLEDDIALLGFKVAANGSFGKYNLVDQTQDAFMDTTGIDAGASTYDNRSGSNYYSGTVTPPTGGTIDTYTDGGTDYRSHTFLDDGTFTVVAGTISADYFMVAGGGGGGNAGDGSGAWGAGGGGGAGGFLTATGTSLITQDYTITVGDGGAGAGYQISAENGTDGANSIIAPVSGTTYTALGGGAGASGVGTSTACSVGGTTESRICRSAQLLVTVTGLGTAGGGKTRLRWLGGQLPTGTVGGGGQAGDGGAQGVRINYNCW